eukprot:1482241-Rhodomonas_salina.1
MLFVKGIWRLPTFTQDKAENLHHETYIKGFSAENRGVLESNPLRMLLNLAKKVEPLLKSAFPADVKEVAECDQQVVQLLHDEWLHPSNNKLDATVQHYKRKGFPPGFLKALKKFRCKVCTICKGARVYKHTKRVQEKMAKGKAVKGKKQMQVFLELEINEEDYFLHAFREQELHMDYAHLIALGYAKERYYLLFVACGTNFMWAVPTETSMEPEELLQDFMTLSGFRTAKIRVDWEFDASSAFKAF